MNTDYSDTPEFIAGEKALKDGIFPNNNPYEFNSVQHFIWNKGYENNQAETRRPLIEAGAIYEMTNGKVFVAFLCQISKFDNPWGGPVFVIGGQYFSELGENIGHLIFKTKLRIGMPLQKTVESDYSIYVIRRIAAKDFKV